MHPVRQNHSAATHPRMDPMILNNCKLFFLGLIELFLAVVMVIVVILMHTLRLVRNDPFVTFTEIIYILIPPFAASFGVAAWSNPSRWIFLTNLALSTLALGTTLTRAATASYAAHLHINEFSLNLFTPDIWYVIVAIDSCLSVILFVFHVIYSAAGLSCCTNMQGEQQTFPVHVAQAQHIGFYPVNPHGTDYEMRTFYEPPLNPNQSDLATHSLDIASSRDEDRSSVPITNQLSTQSSSRGPDDGDEHTASTTD